MTITDAQKKILELLANNSSPAALIKNLSNLRGKKAVPAKPVLLDVKILDRDRTLKAADGFLNDEPITVTASRASRSAGGEHDFFSEGDYWWPDPQNPDGPYIRKDGVTNPDNFADHRNALMNMSVKVAALTAAFQLTNGRHYADGAIKHLRAWFIDEKTRMNPNLEYAQAVHKKFTGRSFGVIDSIHLIEPVRSAQLLERTGLLAGEDLAALKKWFFDYLSWLKTSKNSVEAMNTRNNHSTCWVMQVAAYSIFVGDAGLAAWCRKRFKEVLIPNQQAPLPNLGSPAGSFPHELGRTRPYNYSNFNLDAMCTICELLSTSSDNLWNFSTPDGRNVHQAVEFMYPFLKDKSLWLQQPFVQGPDVMFWDKWPVRYPSLLFAGVAYGEQKYIDLWKTLPSDYSDMEVLRNVPVRTPMLWAMPID